MVGEAQAQGAWRFTAGTWILAIGISVLALGMPCARYFASMDLVWRMSGSGPTPQGLLTLPVFALHHLFGLHLEASAFLISALLLGLSYPAMVRLLRVVGIETPLAMAASGIALASPMAWLGGTLPMEYSAGLLGSTLLATELFRTGQERPFGYLWRASSMLLIAFLMSQENLWLVAPSLWAVRRQAATTEQGRLSALGLLSVFAFCLWITLADREERGQALMDLAFGDGLGSSTWTGHALFWCLGLGALWYAFFSLIFTRRAREESPPPGWTWIWLIVGLTAMLAGGVQDGPRGAFLIPIGAVALADALLRQVDRAHRGKAYLALFLAHILLNVVFGIVLRASDGERVWLEMASEQLQPGDVFLTDSSPRAYMSAFRLEAPTCLVDSAGEVLHTRDPDPTPAKRLVLDGWERPPSRSNGLWPMWLGEVAGLPQAAQDQPHRLGNQGPIE